MGKGLLWSLITVGAIWLTAYWVVTPGTQFVASFLSGVFASVIGWRLAELGGSQ